MSTLISKSRVIAWAVWFIASIFYAYQYVLRVMPNILLNDIMEQFQLDAASFGQFSGIYYLGYSLMHLPIGIMLDRFGPKKVMSGSILISVLGLTPLLFATHWSYPILGRLLMGMGSSAAILGVFKVIRMTFVEARFARMLSFSATIGLIGAIYGGGPVSYLRENFGYESLIQMVALAGVCLACFTFFLIPNIEKSSNSTVFSDVKEVLLNRKVLVSSIFAGLMVGPLEGFADVWGTAFLKQTYGFDAALASKLPSMIFIGMCFGAPVLSFIAEKSKNYLGTILGSALIMSALFFLLCFSHLSKEMITASFLVVGICCAYQILTLYQATTYVRGSLAGLTTALVNMIIMIFGYAFHSIMGAIVNAAGGPNSSIALLSAVALIPVGLAIGAIGYGGLIIIPNMTQKLAGRRE